MSKFLGTDTIPNVLTLPGTGVPGQIVYLTGDDTYYRWDQSESKWISFGGGVSQLATIPHARAHRTTTQGCNNGVDTQLSPDIEDADTDNIYNTTNGDFTCRTAGVYVLSGYVDWSTSSTVGNRQLKWNHSPVGGGGGDVGMVNDAASANYDRQSVSAVVKLGVGDVVKFVAWQNSGGTQNVVYSHASIAWIGSGNGVVGQQVIPYASVSKTAAQTINNATVTSLSWDAEDYDTDNIHDNTTNNSRLTCRTPGLYLLTCTLVWATATGSGREIVFRKNGVDVSVNDIQAPAWGNATQQSSLVIDLAAGDYMEVVCYQNSGAATTVVSSTHTRFKMVYQGSSGATTTPYARALTNATQTIAAAAWSPIIFHADRVDTDGIHDIVTNRERLTCKTAGNYIITGTFRSAPTSSVTQIYGKLLLNGTRELATDTRPVTAGQDTGMTITTITDLAVGDYVEFQLYLAGNSISVGSSTNSNPVEFTMIKIGALTSPGASAVKGASTGGHFIGPWNGTTKWSFTPTVTGLYLITCNASAFSPGGGRQIYADVSMNSTYIGGPRIFANEANSHKAMVALTTTQTLSAGVTYNFSYAHGGSAGDTNSDTSDWGSILVVGPLG